MSTLYVEEEMPCIVLAGDRNTIPLYPGHTPGPKALLRYGGKTSLEYVLEALERVGRIKEICVVGSEEALGSEIRAARSHCLVPAGSTMADSILTGLDHFHDAEAVFVTTADLPLITEEAVDGFLDKVCSTPIKGTQSFFLSLVPKDAYVGPYEHVGKGFIAFKDISVCHGNLMVLLPEIRKNPKLTRALKRAYERRKSANRAAIATSPFLGLAFFFGVYLLRCLTLSQTARLVSWHLGVRLEPVLIDYPEISLDVDEPRDHVFVKRRLG